MSCPTYAICKPSKLAILQCSIRLTTHSHHAPLLTPASHSCSRPPRTPARARPTPALPPSARAPARARAPAPRPRPRSCPAPALPPHACEADRRQIPFSRQIQTHKLRKTATNKIRPKNANRKQGEGGRGRVRERDRKKQAGQERLEVVGGRGSGERNNFKIISK